MLNIGGGHRNHIQYLRFKAVYVFFSKAAMVMGPTPPGTGVIKLQSGDTSANATSPLRANPLFFEESGTLVMPTSMTTAPSFIMSARTNSGFPRAATTISLFRQISFRLWVWE